MTRSFSLSPRGCTGTNYTKIYSHLLPHFIVMPYVVSVESDWPCRAGRMLVAQKPRFRTAIAGRRGSENRGFDRAGAASRGYGEGWWPGCFDARRVVPWTVSWWDSTSRPHRPLCQRFSGLRAIFGDQCLDFALCRSVCGFFHDRDPLLACCFAVVEKWITRRL